jgi:hypothetical protein
MNARRTTIDQRERSAPAFAACIERHQLDATAADRAADGQADGQGDQTMIRRTVERRSRAERQRNEPQQEASR